MYVCNIENFPEMHNKKGRQVILYADPHPLASFGFQGRVPWDSIGHLGHTLRVSAMTPWIFRADVIDGGTSGNRDLIVIYSD